VLVQDLLTIADRMESVREHLGRWMGISGPQYSLMVAIAHMQGEAGVNVGAVARALHVSSAFIASESGKLARKGLLSKRTSPQDRRGVLLSVSSAGRSKIDGISKQIRAVNDLFFGVLDSASFTAVSSAASTLVESSVSAINISMPSKESRRRALASRVNAACALPRQRVPIKRTCDLPLLWRRPTNAGEALDMISYFVRYRGSSSDPEAFRAHYEGQHAAILRRFPKICSLIVHQPVPWNDAMPVRRGETFLLAQMKFDSIGELDAALRAGARSEAREDFHRFPAFSGEVTHEAMTG
jgi:uncharacterized protein (TIGR02118 family)